MNDLAKWKSKPISEFTYYILLALIEPMHGYRVMKKVEEMSEGTVRIGPGTLYGLLSKLEKENLIHKVYEDHRRKIYCLTELGKIILLGQVERLTIMSKNGQKAVEQMTEEEGEMDKKRIRKFKLFWAWQDKKQENWLRHMSLQGWHLRSLGWWIYVFEQGEPQEYTYRLDFRRKSKEDLVDYLVLFEEAGWEHLGKFDGWQYFRKVAQDGIEEEIYTDTESKIQKYQRMLLYFLLGTPGFLVVFLYNLDKYPAWFAAIMVSVIVTAILFGGLNSLMISLRIRELKNQ